MSGHSKWNNIKNKKAATDAKRSKEFTNVSKLITIAVKQSGMTDPAQNAGLRLALEKARAVNMPNANIKRAIDRGAGKSESGASLEEILYEGYGPHGVGFIVLAHTDNKQRTGGEIRYSFSYHGGSLAGPGAAMYLFSPSDAGYEATIPVPLSPADFASVQALVDELEEHDDVDGVWHNGVESP